MTEKPRFRPAMTWLHSWAGLILGTLLMTIWWTGTLSVFDKEIDRWMQPETRIPAIARQLDADSVISRVAAERPDDRLSSLLIYRPEKRTPFFETYAEFSDGESLNERLHPETGDLLGERRSLAGSGFLYTMHYTLHSGAAGYVIVALATLFMMTLLVTGVVIHRKIFADFFTFRPKKNLRRSSLDLHNISGTIFLPFHFLICLSGLAIFAGFYAGLPLNFVQLVDPSNRAVELYYPASGYGHFDRDASGESAKMAPVQPMVERAEAIWTERYGRAARADRIDITHYGDANAYVEVRRHFPSDRTDARSNSVNFDAVTGEVLADFRPSAVQGARAWLEGFHQIRFDHWPIRWLYFCAGLSGCVMIGTGFLFWTASRKRKADGPQPFKIRLVDAMSVGSMTGIMVATAAYLVANRLLALDLGPPAADPAGFEIRCFFYVWLLTFAHAGLRKQRSWSEQCWAIGLLALLAVLLNWLTTGNSLPALVQPERGNAAVAGVDLVLLASAAMAALVARRLGRPRHTVPAVSGGPTRVIPDRGA